MRLRFEAEATRTQCAGAEPLAEYDFMVHLGSVDDGGFKLGIEIIIFFVLF